MSPKPTLTDGIVMLRPPLPADTDAMYAAVTESIPELSRWLPWCHERYMRSETESFIELSQKAWADKLQYPFVILDAKNGALLGGISINHIAATNRLANVGYWIRSSCTRGGLAPSAVTLVARYAFGTLGLTRLEIACIPQNAASRRVAEKVGAKLETIARNRLVMHGKAYDAALFSLVPEDIAITSGALPSHIAIVML